MNQIPTHTLDPDQHQRIFTRLITGFYQNIRLLSMYGLLILFFILPFFRYDGRQALWFDIPTQHFYIFGLTFFPQDLFYLAWLLIMAAILLFAVTVFTGRVFCGYACPQTIWTHLYMSVERLFQGPRHQRIRLSKQPMNASKLLKLSATHLVWIVISIATALSFISYVVGTDALYSSLSPANWLDIGMWLPEISVITWVFFAIFSIATYLNAGFMREQMCFYICPYGRFQSVMLDKDSLIVSYDQARGEPRGKKKSATQAPKGDCIDCSMCVQVCPTGIDIRDGLQMECIQCAACVDACNDIMDKVGSPRGLIRYTTERNLSSSEGTTRIFRPKLGVYLIAISLMSCIFIYALLGRVPLEVDVMRDRTTNYRITQGFVENDYLLSISNKTQIADVYDIRVEGDQVLTLNSRWGKMPMDAGENFTFPVSVAAPQNQAQSNTPFEFVITSGNNPDTQVKRATVFIAPDINGD